MLNSVISAFSPVVSLLICLFASLALGLLNAFVFSYRQRFSSSFSLTLVILPAAMAMVVMMINGNLGIAVAVAGSFTLVRFRSIAGNARELCAIFVTMTLGLIVGMGYIGIAALFFLLVAAAVLLLTRLHFGENSREKLLRITIPESYDYASLFDDVFRKYEVKASLVKVKTTNMGSLIEVTYRISMKTETVPKEMLDDLRAKNANLCILISSLNEERDVL